MGRPTAQSKQVSTPPSPPDNTSSLTPATVAAKRAYMRLLSLGSLSEPLQDAAVWPAEAEAAVANIEVEGGGDQIITSRSKILRLKICNAAKQFFCEIT